MNKVEISGGLLDDPKVETVGTTLKVSLALAVSGARYDRNLGEEVVNTIYAYCEAWAQAAEEIAAWNLAKGDQVYVMGELNQVRREGSSDPRPSTRVTVMGYSVLRKHTTA